MAARSRVLLPELNFALRLHVLSFLSFEDLTTLHICSRYAWLIAQRAVYHARALQSHPQHARFLRKHERRETVLLVSYPRSGNSLLRGIIEAMTGVVTGSDTRPDRPLSRALLRCGFLGEGIADDSVAVVKSHFPERSGYIKFPAHRVILLVRNPIDAVFSYFQMAMTNTHDKTLQSEIFEALRPFWDRFAANELQVWNAFHEYWLLQQQVPILVLRFEDIVGLDGPAIPGLADVLQCAMDLPAADGNSATGAPPPGYKPRSRARWGHNLRHFPAAALEYAVAHQETMAKFGYALSRADEAAEENEGTGHKLDVQSLPPELARLRETIGTVVVNDSFELRPPEDEFGRWVTFVRKDMTDDDRLPFPVVGEAPRPHKILEVGIGRVLAKLDRAKSEKRP